MKQVIIDTSHNDPIINHKILLKNNQLYIGNAHSNIDSICFYKVDLNLIKIDSAVLSGSILAAISNYGSKIIASGSGFSQGSAFGNNQVAELDTAFNVISRFNLDSLTLLVTDVIKK